MKQFENFAAICAATGKNEQDYAILPEASNEVNEAICRKRLTLMSKAYNGGKEVDLTDTDQVKYTPVHRIIPDSNSPFGFRLSYLDYGCGDDCSDLGARPPFLELNDAIEAGKQHVFEFEQWLYYTNKAYQE